MIPNCIPPLRQIDVLHPGIGKTCQRIQVWVFMGVSVASGEISDFRLNQFKNASLGHIVGTVVVDVKHVDVNAL